MGPASWPDDERPRERLSRLGAGALGDAELLAILLGTGTGGGRHVYEVAMDLLSRLDGVAGIDAAAFDDLTAVSGVGVAKAAVLKAAIEIGRRSLAAGRARAVVRRSRDLYEICRARFHGADREMVVCAFFDTGLKLLGEGVFAVGGAAQCLVDTRLLMKDALVRGASAIALLHNHPSGERTPSAEDRRLTARVAAAACAVGVQLVDHLIVFDGGYYSFADGGEIGGADAAARGDLVREPVSSGRPSPWFPCRP